MADNSITNQQKQHYTIGPTKDDGSPGKATDIRWTVDSDGIDMVPSIDGLSADAVPDDDFVTVSDVTVTVRGRGAGGAELEPEFLTLQVTAVPAEDGDATVLNLSAGEPVDK